MNIPLKKCPFCDGQAEIIRTSTAYYIQCRNCCAMMGRSCKTFTGTRNLSFDTEEQAVEAWNKRRGE